MQCATGVTVIRNGQLIDGSGAAPVPDAVLRRPRTADPLEAAHAATHCKASYLAAQYHRLVLRRGAKKATIAVGHTLLVIVYHVLADEKDYQELGGNYFDERRAFTLDDWPRR